MKLVATIFSYLFHPVFAPLFSAYILFQLPTYLNYKISEELIQFIYGVILLNLIITPILITFFLKRKNYINSFEMHTAKERVLPYFVSALFYIFTYFLFRMIQMPHFYLSIFFAAFVVIIVLFVFALFNKKISAHLAGLGGICGMLFMISRLLSVDTTFLMILFIILSGFVASSRMKLNAHSLSELALGFAIGFCVQLLIIS